MFGQRASMVELLSILCDIFSKEPPVMSRPQVPNAPQQSSRPPPVPPHPPEQSQASSQASASTVSQPAPPRLPPKQQVEADQDRIPKLSPLSRYDAPPPLPEAARSASSQPFRSSTQAAPSQSMPQRHISLSQSMTPQQFQQQHNFVQAMPPQGGSNVRFSTPTTGIPPQRTPSATSNSHAGLPFRQSAVFQSESTSQNIPDGQSTFSGTPSQFPPHLQQNPSVATRYQQKAVHQKPPPQPKPQPVNLLDSPFDINLPVYSSADIPAPPIPPNPEKDALLSALSQSITQTLHHDISQNVASLPLLRSQNEALHSSLRTLESELSQLQALQGTLTGNVSILQSSLREADKCISSAHARAQRGEIPKIDEMLTAPTVVGKQLYDVLCDERGIEAATLALQAALTRGRISMDVWAKKTRELSREGFKRKVLSKKIAGGIGLE
jgi:ESCRT-I complex subunit TSG101